MIKDYVISTFKVSFPIFSLTDVNGPSTHKIYKYLRQHSSLRVSKPTDAGLQAKQIPWNFTKFLLNSKGEVVDMVAPFSKASTMESKIEKLINEA